MPKALCMIGMATAILLLALFTVDLVMPLSLAPFSKGSMIMDIVMVLCGAALGYISWTTYKEQR